MSFLFFSAFVCIAFSIIYLLIEIVQLLRRGKKYLKDVENYIQVLLNITVLIFVLPLGEDNWILPIWKWQIGSIAVFLGWLNSIILLKSMPYFGVNITMLISVGENFLSQIALFILLILTFSFPFYMLMLFDETFFQVT